MRKSVLATRPKKSSPTRPLTASMSDKYSHICCCAPATSWGHKPRGENSPRAMAVCAAGNHTNAASTATPAKPPHLCSHGRQRRSRATAPKTKRGNHANSSSSGKLHCWPRLPCPMSRESFRHGTAAASAHADASGYRRRHQSGSTVEATMTNGRYQSAHAGASQSSTFQQDSQLPVSSTYFVPTSSHSRPNLVAERMGSPSRSMSKLRIWAVEYTTPILMTVWKSRRPGSVEAE
mmetsp:Transcript_90754/g.277858  ORF Transcript_90754/g.277858 Transcript_90754/m.277858 type:complete len:235 (-) Transcript_90754:210-914(-)